MTDLHWGLLGILHGPEEEETLGLMCSPGAVEWESPGSRPLSFNMWVTEEIHPLPV